MLWLDKIERIHKEQGDADCLECQQIGKLIAAVKLADNALNRVYHSGMHRAAIGIAEKAIFCLASGNVGEA